MPVIINAKYDLLNRTEGNFLGAPNGGIYTTQDGRGRYQRYDGGAIYRRVIVPLAFEIHGEIWVKWKSLGEENGFLGYPISDETPPPSIQSPNRHSLFDGGIPDGKARGAIVWTPIDLQGNGVRTYEIHGPIFQKWSSDGSIIPSMAIFDNFGDPVFPGFPLTDVLKCADGQGEFIHFTGCSFFWSQKTGAWAVSGLIKDIYASIGWERSPLGYPSSDPQRLLGSTTIFQRFEKGSIYVARDNSTHVSIQNSISAWGSVGRVIFIDFADFGNTALPDKDIINVSVTGHGTIGDTTITLNKSPQITTRKEISLWSPSRGKLRTIQVSGRTNTSFMTVTPLDLESNDLYLVFSRESFWFFSTDVYWLGNANRLIGNDVVFNWVR